ncbi:MAG: lasso peptide biosynthesis PqqD family chaperone [Candidatus Hydrogenedentes bacterium]|nr:lasso peptide biosynthesis PqqD family chaperone [Candidatus Hydrogenedentota bacterium]
MSSPVYFDPATVFERGQDLITSEVDGETVMMSVSAGSYFGLDPLGSRIWDLLESPKSIQELTTALQAEYDVDEPTCTKDLSAFFHRMLEHGVVGIRTGD